MASCQSQASDAASACNFDDSTYSSDNSGGLAASCTTMQKAGYKSGTDKSTAANACMQKWSVCYNTCKSAANKYSDGDNASTFSSYASLCSSYKDKVDTLLQASNDSASAATAGLNCDSNSSSSPSAGSGSDDAKDKTAQSDTQKAAECTANPAAAGCTEAAQYAAALKATGQFGEADANKGQADVLDTSSIRGDPSAALANQAPAGGGIKNGTVANNTGGGIPGGGGSPHPGGGGPLAQALGMMSSAITAIEKGFLAATGLGTPTPPDESNDNKPVVDQASIDPAQRGLASLKGKELKKFLPGQIYGPRPYSESVQFHGKYVDLFSRIHERMHEKCVLGELIDCQG